MKAFSLKPMFLILVFVLLGLSAIVPSSAANATERCHPNDKRALLRIKQQSFKNSTTFDSWDPATDCCNDWFSVRCDDSTNRINGVLIIGTDIEGTPFPSALSDLPYLDTLIFHNNATGPIPASLGNLRRLINLDLSFNLLTGPIPASLAKLRRLIVLNLSVNLLTGPIPSFFGAFQNLSTLDLSSNLLTGAIPPSLALASRLSYLGLSNNKLSGEIPRSLEKVKVNILNVSSNELEGDASFLFSKDKTAARFFDFSGNSFSFDMTNLGFPNMMNVLDLSRNRIYGSLPEGLAHLPELNVFNVSYNQLCGRIPTGGTLKLFDQTNYFHNKCLCGTPLPPCK